jgi:hypothetical protein
MRAVVAIGAARLGLKAVLISRVGDEPMGRFARPGRDRCPDGLLLGETPERTAGLSGTVRVHHVAFCGSI